MRDLLSFLPFSVGFLASILVTLAVTLVVRVHALQLAGMLIRGWNRALTHTVPANERTRRLEEIAADVDEHRQYLRDAGYAPDLIAVLILERLVTGIGQDLRWWWDQMAITDDMKSLDDVGVERIKFHGFVDTCLTIFIGLFMVPGAYLEFVHQDSSWYTLTLAFMGLLSTIVQFVYKRLVNSKIDKLFYMEMALIRFRGEVEQELGSAPTGTSPDRPNR